MADERKTEQELRDILKITDVHQPQMIGQRRLPEGSTLEIDFDYVNSGKVRISLRVSVPDKQYNRNLPWHYDYDFSSPEIQTLPEGIEVRHQSLLISKDGSFRGLIRAWMENQVRSITTFEVRPLDPKTGIHPITVRIGRAWIHTTKFHVRELAPVS